MRLVASVEMKVNGLSDANLVKTPTTNTTVNGPSVLVALKNSKEAKC